MHLSIADLVFPVDRSRLELFRADSRLCWGFVIESTGRTIEGCDWIPQLSSEVLFETKAGEIESWRHVAPRQVEWSLAATDETSPHATLYLFEHLFIYNCTIDLLPLPNGIELHLQARCDVYFNEQYESNLALEAECPLNCTVLCGRLNEVDARRSISPYLAVEDFGFDQDENGVSRLTTFAGHEVSQDGAR